MKNKIVVSILLVLILVAGVYLVLNQKDNVDLNPLHNNEYSDIAPVPDNIDPRNRTQDTADSTLNDQDTADVVLDKSVILSERILGNPDAPIRISEHSSFTCGHCGKFHKESFADLKANYIDTGRAYLVFSDFPLNAPALHASIVTRCAPQDQYFDFVQYLFEEQEHWAYESNYLEFLQSAAAQYGVNQATFKACLQDQNLQKGILDRMKATQAQWSVQSTPTFVINNKTVVSGALPFAELDQRIQATVNPDGVVTEPVSATNVTDTDITEEPAEDSALTPMPVTEDTAEENSIAEETDVTEPAVEETTTEEDVTAEGTTSEESANQDSTDDRDISAAVEETESSNEDSSDMAADETETTIQTAPQATETTEDSSTESMSVEEETTTETPNETTAESSTETADDAIDDIVDDTALE